MAKRKRKPKADAPSEADMADLIRDALEGLMRWMYSGKYGITRHKKNKVGVVTEDEIYEITVRRTK